MDRSSCLPLAVGTALLTAATVVPGSAALAQNVCAEREALLASLSEDYQESPSAIGMSNGGNVLEVFTARDGKTWTILVTHPDGNSCIVAAGEMWTSLPRQISATPDDTI